jgi:uncharacterized protein (UPF0333 family)
MKSKIILIVVAALILVGAFVMIRNASYDTGYTIGSIESKNAKYKTFIGVYLAQDPEYGSLTLVINEDGTCNDSFGNPGTWTKEGNIITFAFDTFTQQGRIDPETCIIFYEDRLYQKIS